MASRVEHDSELFTNLVAAKGIPSGRKFVAVTDEDGKPAILSLSTDNVLYLYHFENGAMVNLDFGRACGQTGKIDAFDAIQLADRGLLICFSISTSEKTSQIFALPHLELSRLTSPNANDIIYSSKNLTLVYGIWISNYTSTRGPYPDIVVSYQAAGHISKSEDCELLVIGSGSTKELLSVEQKWNLPNNADKISDIAFCRSGMGDGIFVLYEANGAKNIVYTTYNGTEFTIHPKCPAGAECLTTVHCSKGGDTTTVLWVGADKPYYYLPKQYLFKNRDPTPVQSPFQKAGLKDIHGVQLENAFTIWFTDKKNAAYYFTSHTATDPSNGRLVPLLAAGKGGRLSGRLSTVRNDRGVDLVNTIMSVDNKDQLTSLQQVRQNGCWDAYPLMMKAKTQNYEVKSYTTRVKIRTGVNNAVRNAFFKLKCSGKVSAIINGVDADLDPIGQIIQADSAGEVTMIVATTDISTQTFTISDVHDALGTDLGIGATSIDPSKKVNDKIATIKTGADLDKLGFKVDKDVANKAAPMLNALANKASNLSASTSSDSASSAVTTSRVVTSSTKSAALANDIEEFWNWVVDVAEEAEEFFVDLAGDVARFVVKLASETLEFIIDTVDKIGKALSWIWNKLKVAIEDLIKYLGFIFSWGDIVDAKNSISSLLDATLDWGVDQIDWSKQKADEFFVDLKSSLLEKPATAQDKSTKKDDKVEDAKSSIGFNWANDRLKNGGGSGLLTGGLKGVDKTLMDGIVPQIKAAVKTAGEDIERLFRDIVKYFEDGTKEFSVVDVLEIIARDAAVLFVDIMKSIFEIIMTVVKMLVKAFKALGNQTIDIPIFSGLYKTIAGHDLTIFDALSLMIAIPATFIHKIIKEEALPKIDGTVNKDLIAAFAAGNAASSQSAAISSISSYGFLGVTLLSSLVGVLDWAIGDAGEASSGVLDKVKEEGLKLIPGQDKPSAAAEEDDGALEDVGFLSALSVGCAILNVGLTIPKGSKDWKWTPWAIGAFRAVAQTILLYKSPSSKGGRRVVAGANVILAVVQYGFAVRVATEKESNDLAWMRMVSTTCGLVGTCAKVAAIEAGQEPIGLAAEMVFIAATLANVGFQGAYLVECNNRNLTWEPMHPDP